MNEAEKDKIIIMLMRKLKGRAVLTIHDFAEVREGHRLQRIHHPQEKSVEIVLLPPEVTIEGQFRVIR